MRTLSPADVPALVGLCPPFPHHHRLTAVELAAALFPDDQPTWVFGDPAVGAIATARSGAAGFFRLLVVAEPHRRQGVGRSLLTIAEEHLRADGATDITLGADAPHHLWAGVPTDATALCCLAEQLRYRRVGVNVDVDIALDALPPDVGGWRSVEPGDVDAVRAFCAEHHPQWTNEMVRAALAGTLTLAVDRTGHLAGCCAFDGNRRSALGPVAVRRELVGQGAGRAMLLGALHLMRARGDAVAVVQWVGPLRPYVALGGHIGRTHLVYQKSL